MYLYRHIYIFRHIYIYIYICVCVIPVPFALSLFHFCDKAFLVLWLCLFFPLQKVAVTSIASPEPCIARACARYSSLEAVCLVNAVQCLS